MGYELSTCLYSSRVRELPLTDPCGDPHGEGIIEVHKSDDISAHLRTKIQEAVSRYGI